MMHWTAKKIRRATLVLTALCTVVTLVLFASTDQKSPNQPSKDVISPAKNQRTGNDSQNHPPTKNISRRDDDSFMRQQALVQTQRLRHIRETCSKARASNDESTDSGPSYPKNFVVNDKHRLLYCQVPKVASTSWLRVFLVLAGVLSHAGQGKQSFVHRDALHGLRTLDSYGPAQRRSILAEYTRVLFVRNPYTRLLSAFRSKLDASLPGRQSRLWQGWLARIRAYGGNQTAGPGPGGGGSQTGNNNTTAVTFGQFVRFVNDQANGVNKHWMSVKQLCQPCLVNYTFVGKMETLEADAQYFLKSARIDGLVSLPDQSSSSPTNSSAARVVEDSYARVPKGDIQRMRIRYIWDFRLFGYSKPTDGLS